MKNSILILALCVCQFGFANRCMPQEHQPKTNFESTRAEISEAIAAVAKLHDAPAVSCCIVIADEVFFINHGIIDRKSNVKVDERSIYQIASLSKTFVGQVVHELIRNDILKLNASIADYLPESVGKSTREKVQPISLLDLITHRSGLPRDTLNPKSRQKGTYVNYDYSEADLLDDLGKMKLEFKPGEKFLYSNYGYSLLAYLCERASGKDYSQLVREFVTSRLAMSDTTFELTGNQPQRLVTPYDHNYPSVAREPARIGKLGPPTSLYCTTADLAKMMEQQLLDYRDFQKTQAVTTLVLTEHAKEAWSGSGIKYGFGFMNWGNGTYGHGGGMDGYRSEFTFHPKRNFGFILLTSSCESWTQRLTSAVTSAIDSGCIEVLDELVAVETIVASFEQKGPQAGLKTYQQLRSQIPTPLGEGGRVTLVNLAMQYQMNDAAQLFVSDAVSDFPDSELIKRLEKALRDK